MPGMPKSKGRKTARLLVRKGKQPGRGSVARKGSDRNADGKDTGEDGATRKFRRKCSKYPSKKRNVAGSSKS